LGFQWGVLKGKIEFVIGPIWATTAPSEDCHFSTSYVDQPNALVQNSDAYDLGLNNF